MMTEHLYYTDSYTTEFDATVVAVTRMDDRPAVVLDKTYFYPTSGGQPYDTGTLGGYRVVDVVAGEYEAQPAILHLLDPEHEGHDPAAPARLDPVCLDPGQTVHGTIDWARRYDHMQQHSGQHLISQVFYKLFGYETVSVHFGAVDSTLDLGTLDLDVESLDPGQLDQAQLDQAEEMANDLVYANLPIRAYFVSEQELEQIPLRRPPKVSGQIRIVEIAGFDYSACGGTHCRHTGEIGTVKFTRQERRRGQSRITFLCGQRSYQDYRTKHQLLSQTADLFSTEISQVPVLVERNLTQIKELQRELDAAQAEALSFRATQMLQGAEAVGPYRVVAHALEGQTVDAARTLANQVCAQDKAIALFATTDGERATVIFARGADVPLHAGNLLRTTLAKFGGGGGGRPEFAQGGGVSSAQLPDLLVYAQDQVRAEIGAA